MTEHEPCDVAVIGGGIHGAGVAQAAAAAGYDVVVIEQRHLAAGTSGKSSKLIHGGLRYLESRQFRLVRESLHERELLLRLAPTLVKRVPFYIPIYEDTERRPWLLRLGLTFYGVFAGCKRHVGFRSVPRSEWSDLDGLTQCGLQRVFQYWDAQTDDRELTSAVMRSAQSLGARLWCPAAFRSGEVDNSGCSIVCDFQGGEVRLRCQAAVNAAGPWANQVLQLFQPTQQLASVDNVQGTHIELPGVVKSGCFYVEAPRDHRGIFVMPWKDRTLLGTTEHVFEGDPADVEPLDSEIDYLLDGYQHYFPDRSVEVLESWAGLRVLPCDKGSPFGRSRETHLPTNDDQRPRLISVFGGKLTGYRITAERVMQRLAKTLPKRPRRAVTTELPIK